MIRQSRGYEHNSKNKNDKARKVISIVMIARISDLISLYSLKRAAVILDLFLKFESSMSAGTNRTIIVVL